MKEKKQPRALDQEKNSPSEISEDQFDPTQYTDQEVAQVMAYDSDVGKLLQTQKQERVAQQREERKEKQTKFQSDREYHSKVSQPILDEAQEVVSKAPIKKALINQQRRDVASGNTSGIIPFLVDELKLEMYRNPESARFKTANKSRFIETVHELGGSQARPNQFIERQISEAQTALGRDEESNMTVLDLEEFIDDMKLERSRLILQVGKKEREKHGFAKNDIAMKADKLMGDYADKRQDEMAYTIRQRHEKNITDEELTREILRGVPLDTPLTIRDARILMIKNNYDEKKAQAEAKKLGFKIPLESTYMR